MSRIRIDMTGLRFGRLVGLEDVGAAGANRLWSFRCDCGALIERRGVDVRSGHVSSCGCLQSDLSSQRHTKDMVGLRFGRLLVTQRAGPDKHGHVCWVCKCDCGTQHTVAGITLRKGSSRSCGCLHKETASKMGRATKKVNPISKTKEYRQQLVARLRQDPCLAMGERVARMLAHALKALGAIKGGRTFQLLGYTPEQLTKHIEKQFLPGMTWENRHLWHIDHITPISLASSLDDVLALNQLSNLRPLWAEANRKKRARRTSLL